jgi:hypothetical protein
MALFPGLPVFLLRFSGWSGLARVVQPSACGAFLRRQ